MRTEARHDLAGLLEGGKHPGDEEFAYYARIFGCAFLVMPMHEREAVPMIYGNGPVGFQVAHTYTDRQEGEVIRGHYHLLQSWLPKKKSESSSSDGTVTAEEQDLHDELFGPSEDSD